MNTVSAIVTGCRKIEFVEEKLPALGEHDVLIKTDAVGLCHTDLPFISASSISALPNTDTESPSRWCRQ